MKTRLTLCGAMICLSTFAARAADTGSWAGEYTDKKFLNGSATFQLSIEQSGGKIQVSFDAVNNNGQGCAPEAQGMATASGKDKLQFSFRDNEGNAGTGTLALTGDGVLLSLKSTKVAKADCTKFYRDGIRLKRVTK
jgi:hypothetical protein